MVRLKLRRHGKKKQPTYRLVAADSESPRDGRFIEILGHYNPRTDPPTIVLKQEKIMDWLQRGAQPTDSVRMLLTTAGIFQRAAEAPKKPAISEAQAVSAEAPKPEAAVVAE